MKRKLRSVIAALLCASLVTAVSLPLAGCGEAKKYEAAAALADSGDYEAAKAAFIELADYEDAADRVTECDYMIAKETMDSGDYAKAEELLAELGDYEDCEELVTECRYQQALALYEDESYEDADAVFAEMTDYKYSRHLSMICRLKYDVDGYLDEFVEKINAEMKKEDLPFELVRGEDYGNEDGHRFYYVLPAGMQPGDPSAPDVYVSFASTDGEGTEYSRGQLNTFVVLGDLDKYTEKGFEEMFTVFLSAAVIMKSVVADDDDYETYAGSFSDDYQKLFTEVSNPGWSSADDEFEGFETRTSLSIFEGDYIRCFYSMYIPELSRED